MTNTLRRAGAFAGALAITVMLAGCGSTYTARDSFVRARSLSYAATHDQRAESSASLAVVSDPE